MKKIIVLCLSIFMLFGCVSKKEAKVIELGQSEFDGMKITFYKDETEYVAGESSMVASTLYYSTDQNKLRYPTSAPYLISKDKSTKFYVDLYGFSEIFDEEDNIIAYTEEIKYDNQSIYIYHLDNHKKYFEKTKNTSEYSIYECVASATGSSSTCSIEYKVNYDDLMEEINQWEKLDSYEGYVDYKEFRQFLTVDFNKNEIGGFKKQITFDKVELENGNWIIKIDQGDRAYYLLTTQQVELLKELMTK